MEAAKQCTKMAIRPRRTLPRLAFADQWISLVSLRDAAGEIRAETIALTAVLC